MVAQTLEMELHVTEQWSEERGVSYWLKVWGTHLPLDIEINLDQILEVLEEIPDGRYEKPGFWRRDFFAVVRLSQKQWEDVTEYQRTGGVYEDEEDWDEDDYTIPDSQD